MRLRHSSIKLDAELKINHEKRTAVFLIPNQYHDRVAKLARIFIIECDEFEIPTTFSSKLITDLSGTAPKLCFSTNLDYHPEIIKDEKLTKYTITLFDYQTYRRPQQRKIPVLANSKQQTNHSI